jgi:hypothetical protein
MKFKEFFKINEGFFSDLFKKKESELGPKKLANGGTAATSYGGCYRQDAIARKWKQIRSEGDAERQEIRRGLGQ